MTTSRPLVPAGRPADLAAAAVQAWVGWYTSRLPEAVAAERRALIDSDLWEEAQLAGLTGGNGALARQRVSRLIRGVPDDVTWRVDQGRASRRAAKGDTMRISRTETIVLASVGAIYGAFLIVSLFWLTQPDPDRWGGWGPYGLAASLALSVAGLIVAFPRPAVGFALAVAGTLVAVAAMPWAWFILLPLPLAALYRLGRSRSRHAVAA